MTTEEQKILIEEILKNNLIQKYILKHTWISGEDTVVYPAQGWINTIEIQISIDENIFDDCIQEIVKNSNENLLNGKFIKSDGSCPSYIEFVMKDSIIN